MGPKVAGRCPACDANSLFLGAGGHVTCAVLSCSDPAASDRLLHRDRVTDPRIRLVLGEFAVTSAIFDERGEKMLSVGRVELDYDFERNMPVARLTFSRPIVETAR